MSIKNDRFAGVNYSYMFCGPLRLRPRLRAMKFGWIVLWRALRGYSLQIQFESARAIDGTDIAYRNDDFVK